MYEKYDQIDVTVLPVRALKKYSPISFFFIFFFFFWSRDLLLLFRNRSSTGRNPITRIKISRKCSTKVCHIVGFAIVLKGARYENF